MSIKFVLAKFQSECTRSITGTHASKLNHGQEHTSFRLSNTSIKGEFSEEGTILMRLLKIAMERHHQCKLCHKFIRLTILITY